MRHYDYLIIGQGIAGTCMAYQLLKRNKKVLIINDSKGESSSRAAGGILNPVTGRKMVLTWKATELFPYLHDFYQELEEKFQSRFFHQTPVYRPFVNIEEQNEWLAKWEDEVYRPFIRQAHGQSLQNGCVADPYGGLELKRSGWIDTTTMLDSARRYFEKQEAYLEEYFDEKQLELGEGQVVYKDFQATKLIYCDGVQSTRSRYFSWLPYRPVKGELLHIKTPQKIKYIYNRGVFILPEHEGIHKVGATYNWKDLGTQPTEEAREQLIGKLEGLMTIDYEIVRQTAGVRPATKDRRPIIGLHPEYKFLGIFNGMGAKGLSLSPYFSGQFCEFLENGKEVAPEVQISRFFSLY